MRVAIGAAPAWHGALLYPHNSASDTTVALWLAAPAGVLLHPLRRGIEKKSGDGGSIRRIRERILKVATVGAPRSERPGNADLLARRVDRRRRTKRSRTDVEAPDRGQGARGQRRPTTWANRRPPSHPSSRSPRP